MRTLTGVVLTGVVLATLPLMSAKASEGCNEFVRNGIYQYKNLRDSSYGQIVLAVRYSQMTYEQVKSKTDTGLTIGIEGLELGGNYSEDYFKTWSQRVKSELDYNNISKHDVEVSLASGDPEIIKGWLQCKTTEGGLSLYITGPSKDAAVVHMQWFPFPLSPTVDPKITSLTPVPFNKILGGKEWAKTGVNIGIRQDRLITIKRSPNKSLLVTVNIYPGGGQEAYLPAEPRPSVDQRREIHVTTSAIDWTASSNVEIGGDLAHAYGKNALHNAKPYNDRANTAQFLFKTTSSGYYMLDVDYAAFVARPLTIKINGEIAMASALSQATGGWGPGENNGEKFISQGLVKLVSGQNILRLESASVFPHIYQFRFIPIPDTSPLVSDLEAQQLNLARKLR